MLNILITGSSGYIASSLFRLLEKYPERYRAEMMEMRSGSWRDRNLSQFDVIVHAAGIVHIKQTKKNIRDFYDINRDMTAELAEKAKAEGVRHFIFLSSMGVYGMISGQITRDTPLNPKNAYSKSKLAAENILRILEDEHFSVAILRPPMVYGENCPGNYAKLKKWAVRLPFFPDIDNARSMLYIGNLCESIRLLAESGARGIFFPQDSRYIRTTEMFRIAAQSGGKKLRLTKIFNPAIRLAVKILPIFAKIFGNLTYDMEMSHIPEKYAATENDKALCLSASGKLESAHS